MSKDKRADQDADLQNYKDLTGVSLKQLNFGLWMAENRRKMIKIIILALIAVIAFFFIYSGYNYIIYFLDNSQSQTAATTPSSPRQVTADLQISPMQIFASDDHFDLVVKLHNPNDKFSATFNYCFVQNFQNITCSDGFILPSEDKYVLALAQNLSAGQSGVSFAVTNISWQRIDAHQIPNWSDFSASRLNFNIADLNFTPAENNTLSGNVGLNTLAFTVTNQTPYGYYQVPLNILLYSGSDLIGVNRYIVSNFLGGETRPVKISWRGSLNAVNRTDVQPDINIVDPQVYLKYQGTTAQ